MGDRNDRHGKGGQEATSIVNVAHEANVARGRADLHAKFARDLGPVVTAGVPDAQVDIPQLHRHGGGRAGLQEHLLEPAQHLRGENKKEEEEEEEEKGGGGGGGRGGGGGGERRENAEREHKTNECPNLITTKHRYKRERRE